MSESLVLSLIAFDETAVVFVNYPERWISSGPHLR